jgi:hypothetical protein
MVDPELRVAGSLVFTQPDGPVSLDDRQPLSSTIR